MKVVLELMNAVRTVLEVDEFDVKQISSAEGARWLIHFRSKDRIDSTDQISNLSYQIESPDGEYQNSFVKPKILNQDGESYFLESAIREAKRRH